MKVSKCGVQLVLNRYRYILKYYGNDTKACKSKHYIGKKADKNKEIIIVKYEELESLSTSVEYGSNYLECTTNASYGKVNACDDLTIRGTIKKIAPLLPASFIRISQDTIVNINLIVGKSEHRLVSRQGIKYIISSEFLESVLKKIDEHYCSVDFFKP